MDFLVYNTSMSGVLFTPWRMAYILSKKYPHCVFCLARDHYEDPEHLVVVQGEYNMVILNRYPYTSGHLMVVPKSHVGQLDELDAPTRSEMMEMASRAVNVLRKIYLPHGFNVGINEGTAAGAGIKEHLHLHVVPRWSGDTNFMSSVGDVRVVPEALDVTLSKVRVGWERLE